MFMSSSEKRKTMTLKEAARKGGIATRDKHGKNHYKKIGKAGGQKVKELIQKGKECEQTDVRTDE